MNIEDRIADVRAAITADGLDAFLVPRADEYLGEYIPPQNERLKWLTGFTGSAGIAIVTRNQSAIFVDGRYQVQVKEQVPAGMVIHHLHDEPIHQWLVQELESGARIGIDTRLHSYQFYKALLNNTRRYNLALVEVTTNPIDTAWLDRPDPALAPAMLLPEEYTGEASLSKRKRVGELISQSNADHAIIQSLDAIAWLLNIRGRDVPRLPVILSRALLSSTGQMVFFADPGRLPSGFDVHVGDGVTVQDESTFEPMLKQLEGQRLLVDPANTSANFILRAEEAGTLIVNGTDPTVIPKAQKNPVEINGFVACHKRDGVAVSRFLHWLEVESTGGSQLDEAILADKLTALRTETNELQDLSFDTISAAGPNGAMCHYNHLDASQPGRLVEDSLYLVDSGGQYLDGTTDITRTVAIGTPSEEHIRHFTLVLKGHIALATAVFPPGTTGVQLDVLARQYLWQAGLDYDHGTGHGVGSFLNVHEGPQRIGKQPVPNGQLRPGMVLSNEPGYYKEGEYGIRCENLMVVVEREDGMLAFDTLTLAPFDSRLIDTNLMTPAEIAWLNDYHARVANTLKPRLTESDARWITGQTTPL